MHVFPHIADLISTDLLDAIVCGYNCYGRTSNHEPITKTRGRQTVADFSNLELHNNLAVRFQKLL